MSESKPTVPEVLLLVQALYARPGGGAGCCLHLVLDDGNASIGTVKFCLQQAIEAGHKDCEELARKLKLMSGAQRWNLYKAPKRARDYAGKSDKETAE